MSTAQTLNFGNLAPGQTLGCDMLIQKNGACGITFSSANLGMLKLTPAPGADSVPYTCTVQSNPITLSSPAQLNLGTGISDPNGIRMPIGVTIGSFSPGIEAGSYQDQITITVIPQ